MNSVTAFVIAVLIYPGALVAVLAALVLGWAREATRGVLAGAGERASGPLATLVEWRTLLQGEAVAPAVREALLTGASGVAVLAPLLALVLLPVPGNPLVSTIGLTGDLAAEAALLLLAPIMRLVVGWAIPSPATRAAADHGARLLAGAILPLALTVTVAGYQLGTLGLAGTPKAAPNGIGVAARVLAAVAFAIVLPVLARTSGSELDELAGRDLASFRIAGALQLAAAAAFFVAAFILPIVPGINTGVGYIALWIVGIVLTAAGVGLWEGFASKRPEGTERPPITWWLGWPLLTALVALVLASWAQRGL